MSNGPVIFKSCTCNFLSAKKVPCKKLLANQKVEVGLPLFLMCLSQEKVKYQYYFFSHNCFGHFEKKGFQFCQEHSNCLINLKIPPSNLRGVLQCNVWTGEFGNSSGVLCEIWKVFEFSQASSFTTAFSNYGKVGKDSSDIKFFRVSIL